MRKPASKIAFIGLLTLLVGLSSVSNAASPLLGLGMHEGFVIPIVLCPGGKTARCHKKPVCKKDKVVVCMCSVRASGTGELVCCQWKCSEGPF